MAGFTSTIHIDAPLQRVWDVFSDLENAAERLSAVKRLEIVTPGEVGAGTRFRETRIMFGKEATEEMEIVEWDPPRGYAVSCESCGARYHSAFRFTSSAGGGAGGAGGTDVEMSFDVKAVSFMAKLMSPLGRIMMGSCRKAFEKDLAELKDAAVSNAAAPATA